MGLQNKRKAGFIARQSIDEMKHDVFTVNCKAAYQ
jgi:hypothetical protein